MTRARLETVRAGNGICAMAVMPLLASGRRAVGVPMCFPSGRDTALSKEASRQTSRGALAELVSLVEVWQCLLVEPVPDDAGRSRACTKGGTGPPGTPWPCKLNRITDMAHRTHHTAARDAS